MYKIFEGANGYYTAWEHDDGFHQQPADNGARLGFDFDAARKELGQRSPVAFTRRDLVGKGRVSP